jgi:hypothetical protein
VPTKKPAQVSQKPQTPRAVQVIGDILGGLNRLSPSVSRQTVTPKQKNRLQKRFNEERVR